MSGDEQQEYRRFADWMHQEMRCEGEKVTIDNEVFIRLSKPAGCDVVQATAIYVRLHETLKERGAAGIIVDSDLQEFVDATARAILDEMLSINDVQEVVSVLARVCRNLILCGRTAGMIERYRLEHPKPEQPENFQ
jgi:hypothetical protein